MAQLKGSRSESWKTRRSPTMPITIVSPRYSSTTSAKRAPRLHLRTSSDGRQSSPGIHFARMPEVIHVKGLVSAVTTRQTTNSRHWHETHAWSDMLRENQLAPAANKSDSARTLAKRTFLCLEIRKHHANPNWANVSAMCD